MLIWLIYDISNDKNRKKIYDLAKQNGLYSVQKSVFVGRITNNKKEKLINKIEFTIDLENDSIYIFKMNQDNFRDANFLGKAFDKKLINDEIETFFI